MFLYFWVYFLFKESHLIALSMLMVSASRMSLLLHRGWFTSLLQVWQYKNFSRIWYTILIPTLYVTDMSVVWCWHELSPCMTRTIIIHEHMANHVEGLAVFLLNDAGRETVSKPPLPLLFIFMKKQNGIRILVQFYQTTVIIQMRSHFSTVNDVFNKMGHKARF